MIPELMFYFGGINHINAHQLTVRQMYQLRDYLRSRFGRPES